MQTCSAHELVKFISDNSVLAYGACVGREDIEAIIGGGISLAPPKNETSGYDGKSQRNCMCYTFKDVGSKLNECKHGCRYCFANPKMYEF